MRLYNASSAAVTLTDMRVPGGASWGLTIPAGAYVNVYGEDAEKSDQLIALLTAGTLTKISTAEPHDSTAVAANVGALEAALDALTIRVAALEART